MLHAAWFPAVVSIAVPMLAWGALAAAVPVLIHLVLRQRPRRQLLPTMRFLIEAHRSSTRAHRLKRLLLLACRMTVILLAVGLLMKTGCAPPGDTAGASRKTADGPASLVIAIDDSASMQYRYQGKTRLEEARTWAQSLLADPERFPSGSEVAIVTGSAGGLPPLNWTTQRGDGMRLLREAKAGWHDQPVHALLRQAYGLLATASRPRQELWLITDLAEAAWQGRPPDPPRSLSRVFILDAGRGENRNVALSHAEVPVTTVPAHQSASCRIRVRFTGTDHPCTIRMTVDGELRDRRAVDSPGPDSEVSVDFVLPPVAAGPHELVFSLDPEDALPFDNRRFACISAGVVPPVLVIGERGDSVADMVTAMIAPPSLPPEEHRFVVRRIPGPEAASALGERPLAVLLADPRTLTAGGWQGLSRYVSAAGNLILIPGPNTSANLFAGQEDLLPAPVLRVVDLQNPARVAAGDLSVSYLKPFADPGVDSINDRLIYRRLELGPPWPGSRVAAPFSDRAAAILERRVGSGRVILLAFSPDRAWGQFGTQAAPMIVLLHAMLESLTPRPTDVASYLAGHPTRLRRLDSASGRVRIEMPEGAAVEREIVAATTELPTVMPGHYRVRNDTGQPRPELLYDVNTAESESELQRLSDEHVKTRFPAGVAWVIRDPTQLPRRGPAAPGSVGWTVPLALAAVGLLWLETLFANRFYSRRRADDASRALR